MSDFDINALFGNAMSAVMGEFCFAIPQDRHELFLLHYKFDYSLADLARLVSLCIRPVDSMGFAFALYMCSGSDCLLQTQKQIADALIAFKRNNFTF